MVPTRRAILRTLAVSAAAGASAGCLDRLRETRRRLGAFTVTNRDADGHVFTLRVRDAGEVVHRSRHRVPGREGDRLPGARAPCTWDGAVGSYDVAVRVDDGEWTTRSLAEESSAADADDCLAARAECDRDGGLSIRVVADCARFDGRWLVGSPCARTESPSATER